MGAARIDCDQTVLFKKMAHRGGGRHGAPRRHNSAVFCRTRVLFFRVCACTVRLGFAGQNRRAKFAVPPSPAVQKTPLRGVTMASQCTAKTECSKKTPPGAPQARRHRLCCNLTPKPARSTKQAPAAADILPPRSYPETATARTNRHYHALRAPFGGK